jgi:glycosyltransferase involved in cell wall biosynthesis
MDRGGAELRTIEAVERLGRTEFDTVYVTLSGRAGELEERITSFGDRVVPMRLDLRFPLRFVRYLRAGRVDVVHSHVATFSGATLALARAAGVARRIAHFRSDGDQRANSRCRRVRRAAMRWLLAGSATDIVGVSPGSLDHGWRSDWRADPRCRVVANGIEVRALPGAEDRRSVREELGVAGDAPVICHVGRPMVTKNRRRAVELACHPAAGRPVLLMVGPMADDERQRWRLRARAAGREQDLRLLGTRPDVLRILNAADLTLVTSTREGLPGVVLESLAVGTPVLATDLPGVRWIDEQVEGVRILGADEADEVWARSIASCLAAVDGAGERARVRSSFTTGPFLLDASVAALAALWRS